MWNFKKGDVVTYSVREGNTVESTLFPQVITSVKREGDKELFLVNKKWLPEECLQPCMNLHEFFGAKREIGIHCITEKHAQRLCQAFVDMGRTWCGLGHGYMSDELIPSTCWNIFKFNTVYTNREDYTNLASAEQYGIVVISFVNIIDFWDEDTKQRVASRRAAYIRKRTEMSLQEFFSSDEKIAIHCDTKEKAERLIAKFKDANQRWIGGGHYDVTDVPYIDNQTCYTNRGTYGICDNAKTVGFIVVPFDIITDFQEK